jgi:hypothetical protein
MYRHFQSHSDAPYRTNYGKSGYLVKVILSRSSKIPMLEEYYINRYQPRDNTEGLTMFVDVKNAPDISKQSGVEWLKPDNEVAPF